MANNFFHKYPYTNFHELNLDWILEKISEFQSELDSWKDLAERLEKAVEGIEEMQAEIVQLQADVADLKAIQADLDTITAICNQNTGEIEKIWLQLSGLDNRFYDIENRITNEVARLNQLIAAVTLEIESDYNSKFYQVARILDDLQHQIDLIDTSVINPWHFEEGKVSPDRNNRLIYNDLSDECLTAEEYLKLEIMKLLIFQL